MQAPAATGVLALANARGLVQFSARLCECARPALRRGDAPVRTAKGVGGTAMRRGHFLLLYAAMLVAASGNTAVQSVMPAIGRAMAIPDVAVAIAYTISAVLWVLLAPSWARASDRHGRKALTLLGVGGFVVSTSLCGLALEAGLSGWVGGAAAFVLFGFARAIYGALGSRDAERDPGLSRLAHPAQRRASTALSALASSFGLGTVIGPAMAPLFVLRSTGLPGPFFGFALIGLAVWLAIWRWLPDDTRPRHGRRAGHGAAMSYPSIATPTTGASVVAATAPRSAHADALDRPADPPLDRRRGRVRPRPGRRADLPRLSRHRPACARADGLGRADRDRADGRRGRRRSAAQWGLIPRLAISPRALVAVGALIAAAGFVALAMVAATSTAWCSASRSPASASASPAPASPAAQAWPCRSASRARSPGSSPPPTAFPMSPRRL